MDLIFLLAQATSQSNSENITDITWVLGGITTVIAALTSATVYLFKLYYVDTKAALNECKEQHKLAKEEFHDMLKAEKADCDKEIAKLSAVIDSKQTQLSDLHKQMLELTRNQNLNLPKGS